MAHRSQVIRSFGVESGICFAREDPPRLAALAAEPAAAAAAIRSLPASIVVITLLWTGQNN
jgi:hypothetical protein